MATFILEIIIVLSFGGLLFLLARALPRLAEEEKESDTSPRPHWFLSYLETADDWLKMFFEKTLRRMKVLILKFDNVVSEKLSKIKKENQRGARFAENEEDEPKEDIKITPEGE